MDLLKLIKVSLKYQHISFRYANKSLTLSSPERCNQRGTTTTTTSYVQLRHKVCACVCVCVECVTRSDLRIRICLAYVFINLT